MEILQQKPETDTNLKESDNCVVDFKEDIATSEVIKQLSVSQQQEKNSNEYTVIIKNSTNPFESIEGITSINKLPHTNQESIGKSDINALMLDVADDDMNPCETSILKYSDLNDKKDIIKESLKLGLNGIYAVIEEVNNSKTIKLDESHQSQSHAFEFLDMKSALYNDIQKEKDNPDNANEQKSYKAKMTQSPDVSF